MRFRVEGYPYHPKGIGFRDGSCFASIKPALAFPAGSVALAQPWQK